MHGINVIGASAFMAGIKKCRRICYVPTKLRFMPEGADSDTPVAIVSFEELEALRLCDMEGMEQDYAAARMDISRGTFQRILYSARGKVANALCTGKGIFINGGYYELAQRCCEGGLTCSMCRFRREKERKKFESKEMYVNE